jgi:4a-hydroxytetrahydrobiopterin dehydratase
MDTPAGWTVKDGKLMRSYTFASFMEAFSFICNIGTLAEELNHQPEIWNSYNKVTLTLFTHDAHALTDKDYELAQKINEFSTTSSS